MVRATVTASLIGAAIGCVILALKDQFVGFVFPAGNALGSIVSWLLGMVGSVLIFWFCVRLSWWVGSHNRGRQFTNYFGLFLAIGTAVWSYYAVSGSVSDTFNQALLLGWMFQVVARVRLKKPAPGVKVSAAGREDVYALVSRQLDDAIDIASHWPRTEVIEFVSMVVNPDTHRGRVTEDIKVERTVTSKSVHQMISHDPRGIQLDRNSSASLGTMKDKPKELVYLPILHPMKGHVYDGMKILVQGADSPRSLSYHQSQVRYLAAIMVLYREAYDLSENFADWGEGFITRFSTLVSKFMLPANLLLTKDQVSESLSALEECFAPKSHHPGAHASAKFMANTCIERYTIVLCVERQDWYDVSYEYILDTRQLLPRWRLGVDKISLKRAWRSVTSPAGSIVVPLSRAHRCSSFHLEISVPSGSYIGATTVINEDQSVQERSSYPSLLGQFPYVRMPTLGLSRAHLYLRSSQVASDPATHASEVKFNVYEKPYGSDLLATLWLVVVVGISAVAKQALLEEKIATANLLAFSIAFPLMLTTAVTVFTARAKNSLNVSVSALALSVCGAVLLVWEVSMLVVGLATKDADITSKVWSDGLWTALLAVGLCFALLAGAIFVIRITRFTWFFMLCVYGGHRRTESDQPEGAVSSAQNPEQEGGKSHVDH